GSEANQVSEDVAVSGLDHGAVGHADHEVSPSGAVAVAARSCLAVSGSAQRPAVEVEQRRHAQVDLEYDITAVAAIASVRTAERLELLPVNRRAAVTAVARLNEKFSLVSELSHTRSLDRS